MYHRGSQKRIATFTYGSNSGNDRYTAPRAIAEVKNIRTRSIKAVLVRSSDDPTLAEVSGISSLIVLGSSPDFAIASFDEFCPFSLCLFNSEIELAWLCSSVSESESWTLLLATADLVTGMLFFHINVCIFLYDLALQIAEL